MLYLNNGREFCVFLAMGVHCSGVETERWAIVGWGLEGPPSLV